MKIRLIMIALALTVVGTSCDQGNRSDDQSTAATTDSALVDPDKHASFDPAQPAIDINWDELQKDLNDETFPEIKGKNVKVRGNKDRTIYSIDEQILFDTDKAEIRSGAKNDLQEIAASLTQRYPEGRIYVQGHTDAEGSKPANQSLSKDRAEAVKQWLISEGKVNEDRISARYLGEHQPTESNATAEGRQQNRRVEIIAVK
jgi:outer membrane protein OmpA-like peptidoglycan-associated protein